MSKTSIDLSLKTSEVRITPSGYKEIYVELQDVEKSDILDYFTPQEIIDHFSIGDLLDAIGEKEVFGYYNIED